MKQISVAMMLLLAALLILSSGCAQNAASLTPSGQKPVVAIVYGSDKGDLSYTDAASRGLEEARNRTGITSREFFPQDFSSLPAWINSTSPTQRPGMVITVGFQYADFTRSLADTHPDIQFLAIDQAGIGSSNLNAYEISSYGDSYLAGVLAATASKTGKIGIIMGMQSGVLDEFLAGYTSGARAVNATIQIESAYVHRNSTRGFYDPDQAGRIADTMFRNGTDVIYVCAGGSNTGAFAMARNTTGRYFIGTDSDQSPNGPEFILASAVKRVDRIVSDGITDRIGRGIHGGNTVAGLNEGATGIVINPVFFRYNATVQAWESRALAEESRWISSRP